jgi:hypothetical protein
MNVLRFVPLRPRWQQRLLSGLAFAWSIVTAPFAFLAAFYGPIEISMGHRRGHDQPVCPICCIDVHDIGEQCPEQWVGECDLCAGTVDLDHYRNCGNAGSRYRFHHVSNRRPKTRRELRQAGACPAAPAHRGNWPAA